MDTEREMPSLKNSDAMAKIMEATGIQKEDSSEEGGYE